MSAPHLDPPPALRLRLPDQRVITVEGLRPEHTVDELAQLLGWPPGALRVDGRLHPGSCSLQRAGLHEGSLIERPPSMGGSDTPTPPPGRPVVVLEVDAGPDAGHRVPLPPGRHVVGRAPSARIRLDDEHLEPHHVALDVSPGGEVRLFALAGRAPRWTADADAPTVVGTEPTTVAADVPVELGASRLVLRRSAAGDPDPVEPSRAEPTLSARADPRDPWRRPVHRGCRPTPTAGPAPGPVSLPEFPEPTAVAAPALLGPAVTGLGVSALVAALTGQILILLVGGALAAAAVGGWGVARLQRWRAARRHRSQTERALVAFDRAVAEHQAHRAAELRRRLPSLPEVLARVDAGAVWGQHPSDPSAWWVAVGPGWVDDEALLSGPPTTATEWAVVERHRRLHDVPVAVDLAPGRVVGLAGPHRDAVARAMLVQLAGSLGPADWRLHVRSRQPERWSWTSWLPHRVNPDELVLGERAVVAVVDDPTLVSARTAPLRRALAQGAAVAVLVLADHRDDLPAWCSCVVELGPDGRARRDGDGPTALARAAGLSAERACAAAAALAGWSDPEDGDDAASIPVRVSAAALHGPITVEGVLERWRLGGRDPAPVVPLGLAADGVVEVDLVRDGPHGLVAGTTGAGKSELVRTLVVGAALSAPPEHLAMVLVDYKGGAAFDACAELPHVVGVVTDLDEHLAERVLRSLEAELRRREQLLRAQAAADLAAYRQRLEAPSLARLVVVVDEFAALAAEVPGFIPALVSVAQRGRSLGVHLVLATQRPGGAVSDDIRANTNLRIALRVQDVTDSVEVLGDPAAARLPRAVPGRAVLRLGAGELITFQTASTSIPAPSPSAAPRVVGADPIPTGTDTLAEIVSTVAAAAAAWPTPPPTPPWLAPLPDVVDPAGLEGTAATVGLVDDPDHQRRLPLSWARRGHLLIVGATGSGTTSALVALARSLTSAESAELLHLYVIDGRGEPRLSALADLPHVGAVVRVGEVERLARLVARLGERIDAGLPSGGGPAVVVLVDGVVPARAALDDGRAGGWLDRFDRIVAEGPAAGVLLAVTAEQPAQVPAWLVATCEERWVLRLADPTEAGLVGVPARAAPTAAAPPGRAVVWPALLEAQVASPEGWPSCCHGSGPGPLPIGVLPAEVPADAGRGWSSSRGGGCRLFVGLGSTDLAPVTLDVPAGEHVTVIGPPRSGRTGVLARLAQSWQEATGVGRVLWWSGRERHRIEDRRDELVGSVGEVLLVVDDADLVDDPDGWLARLLAGGRPGLTVVVSARPGALRSAYGHWTQIVRRSRRGLLLDGIDELDADLLGAALPRDRRVPTRPGRGWLVVDGVARDVVQVARYACTSGDRSPQASSTPSTMCTVRSQ